MSSPTSSSTLSAGTDTSSSASSTIAGDRNSPVPVNQARHIDDYWKCTLESSYGWSFITRDHATVGPKVFHGYRHRSGWLYGNGDFICHKEDGVIVLSRDELVSGMTLLSPWHDLDWIRIQFRLYRTRDCAGGVRGPANLASADDVLALPTGEYTLAISIPVVDVAVAEEIGEGEGWEQAAKEGYVWRFPDEAHNVGFFLEAMEERFERFGLEKEPVRDEEVVDMQRLMWGFRYRVSST